MSTELSDREQIEFLNKLMDSESNIINESFYKMDTETKKGALKTLLRYNNCEIKFKKVDGSLRTMPCTLNPSLLPPVPVHESNTNNPVDFPKVRKQSPENLSVWCIDKQEWRSFKLGNVISVRVIDYSVK